MFIIWGIDLRIMAYPYYKNIMQLWKTEADLHDLIPQGSLGTLLHENSKWQKSIYDIITLYEIWQNISKTISVILFMHVCILLYLSIIIFLPLYWWLYIFSHTQDVPGKIYKIKRQWVLNGIIIFKIHT